ncbi:transketolase [candidate division KSB1 bacterium]
MVPKFKKNYTVEQLEQKALTIRRNIITMLTEAQTGHLGGPMSVADFGTALFFNEANIKPDNPAWPERDVIFFSIGHVTPVIYSLMAEAGYFPRKDLLGFRKFGAHLQGHPSKHDTPGIEVSSGSLGQGLSVAVGVAIGIKSENSQRRVYCIMGDGEQQEGQIWEAAMSASHYRLDNLCAVIDNNDMQIDGLTHEVMNVQPLDEKYRAFGWHTITIDGHDMKQILDAFAEARTVKDRPTVIIANTVMGKGVKEMENDFRWHGKPPSPEQGRSALNELGTTFEEWVEYLKSG